MCVYVCIGLYLFVSIFMNKNIIRSRICHKFIALYIQNIEKLCAIISPQFTKKRGDYNYLVINYKAVIIGHYPSMGNGLINIVIKL